MTYPKYESKKFKKTFHYASFSIFFHDLKSCMLCNVKRPDDVTTAESNPVGFRFAINRFAHQIESITPSSQGHTADTSTELNITKHAADEMEDKQKAIPAT